MSVFLRWTDSLFFKVNSSPKFTVILWNGEDEVSGSEFVVEAMGPIGRAVWQACFLARPK